MLYLYRNKNETIMKTEILDRIIYRLLESINIDNNDKTNCATFNSVADCEKLKQ